MRWWLAALLLLAWPRVGLAHPHVWADTTLELLIEAGQLVGVRVHWVFDEMYSASFIPEVDANGNGMVEEAETTELVQRVFVEGAADLAPFVLVQAGGVRQAFAFANAKVWMEGTDALHYRFDVMLTTPQPLATVQKVATYDPEFYIDFAQAYTLAGSENSCAWKLEEDREIWIYDGLVNPEVYQLTCKETS